MTQIACTHCDLLINTSPLEKGQQAVCPRCKQTLYLDDKSLTTSIALLYTALIVYIPAITLPFLSIETAGQVHSMSLITSITTISHGRSTLLAAVVFALVLLLPLIKLIGLLLVTSTLVKKKSPLFTRISLRYLIEALPWSMLEVYLIGVLITLVKLTSYASVSFLSGFYAFILLIILNAIISVQLPKQRLWQRVHVASRTP